MKKFVLSLLAILVSGNASAAHVADMFKCSVYTNNLHTSGPIGFASVVGGVAEIEAVAQLDSNGNIEFIKRADFSGSYNNTLGEIEIRYVETPSHISYVVFSKHPKRSALQGLVGLVKSGTGAYAQMKMKGDDLSFFDNKTTEIELKCFLY